MLEAARARLQDDEAEEGAAKAGGSKKAISLELDWTGNIWLMIFIHVGLAQLLTPD